MVKKSKARSPKPVRSYKDRLFRMIFKEKKEFLELYNAMNGTDYQREEDLTVTTLEHAIYMGMRNDVSFLLYDQLTLYEHQATVNPNMPLRNLFYVADIYSDLTKDENLYGSRQVRLPRPKFVVFYNGVEEMEERSILKLSDAFAEGEGEAELELKVLVLNINPGFNQGLTEKCRTLRDYMIFVSRIRQYSQELELEEAVEQAIDECISEGILEKFLRKNRAEVKKVSIYEYDEEKHIRQEREDAKEDGRKEGREEGERIKVIQLILDNMQRGVTEEAVADFLGEECSFVQEICSIAKEHSQTDSEAVFELWRKKIRRE